MKKFRFKLEPVLKERKRAEDLRLKEWSIAKKILERMKTELKSLEEDVLRSLKESDLTPIDIGMRNAFELFIEGTKVKISWKKREIIRAEKLVEKTKLAYVLSTQKRKILEKYKEKHFLEFKKEVHKRELKELDDVYIMRRDFLGEFGEEK